MKILKKNCYDGIWLWWGSASNLPCEAEQAASQAGGVGHVAHQAAAPRHGLVGHSAHTRMGMQYGGVRRQVSAGAAQPAR
eukprot:COSAG02_NODE_46932_length_345_cov_0.613821_1_plen_79_part_01